jgi:hypothetical protein
MWGDQRGIMMSKSGTQTTAAREKKGETGNHIVPGYHYGGKKKGK